MRRSSPSLVARSAAIAVVALAVSSAAAACRRDRAPLREGSAQGATSGLPRAADGARAAPAAAKSKRPEVEYDDPSLGLAWLCARAKRACPPRAPRVVVDKPARALHLFDGAVRLATFPVGLGPSPEGPKLKEGDGRTPEGKLRVVTRNAQSKYRRFLGLGYPTSLDGARGLRDGLISRAEADAIARAEHAGAQPPWGTKLGGAVGIHGSGSAFDWTAGCVALDDDAIDVLWAAVPIGAEVEILP